MKHLKKHPKQNDWETEYTKLIKDKLDYPGAYRNCDGFNCTPDKMRNFIHQLLADARKEDRKKIENLRIKHSDINGCSCPLCLKETGEIDYNMAITDVLATLRKEPK